MKAQNKIIKIILNMSVIPQQHKLTRPETDFKTDTFLNPAIYAVNKRYLMPKNTESLEEILQKKIYQWILERSQSRKHQESVFSP